MYNKAKEAMNKTKIGSFIGGVQEEIIVKAEKKLDVVFPVSYKNFLKDYGVGRIGNEEILGITKNNQGWPSVIWNTIEEINFGQMPKELVPVYLYDDEFYFCLDTSEFKDGECPIVAVNIGDAGGERKKTYDSFGALLFEIVKTVIE